MKLSQEQSRRLMAVMEAGMAAVREVMAAVGVVLRRAVAVLAPLLELIRAGRARPVVGS